MLDSVGTVRLDTADPLSDPAAADTFWQKLPRTDPVAAQRAVSEALAGFVARDNPGLGQLQVVQTLDRRAQELVDVLLINYVAGDAQPTVLERGYWQAAFELCRSFGRTYGHLLRSVRDRQHYRRWREHLPSMLVRLFQHRQTELLLRPFVNELLTRFSWREVHEVYEYADSHGLLHQPVEITRFRAKGSAESTLGQEYIQILLQGLVNSGHLSPREAFWVCQRLSQWGEAMTLFRHQARGEDRLTVDLNSDTGLVRSSAESAGARLCLDTAAALAAIVDEIKSLRDAPDPRTQLSAADRSRRLKLLRKVNGAFAPKPPVIPRRGERKPVGATVEIIIGLAQVVGALGRKRTAAPIAASPVGPEAQRSTITMFGGFTGTRTTGYFRDGNSVSPMSAVDLDAGSPLWRLVDRSDSGCRLQGPIFDANWVIPGTLIAFRESAALPWMLAIVRRVEKQADNRADIGVECIGKNPRGVKITVGAGASKRREGLPGGDRTSFAGLFLPESATQPALPVKTLILPARKYGPEERLMLRTVTTLYTIELREPIEEQGDFVWLPFEIVARTPRQDAEAVGG
jgi:hypothetical protein